MSSPDGEFDEKKELRKLRRVLVQRAEQETALIQNGQRRLELTSALGRYQMERAESELRELHLRMALNTAQEDMGTLVSTRLNLTFSLQRAMRVSPAEAYLDEKFALEALCEAFETQADTLRQLVADLATETRAQTLAAERIADVERALALVSEARPELEEANQAARKAKKLQQKLVLTALQRVQRQEKKRNK